jgi:hypothetical protein
MKRGETKSNRENMQRLKRSEIEALNQLIIDAVSAIKDVRFDPERLTWKAYESLYEAFVDVPVRVDMPLGELLNPDLWILPAIWDKQGRLHIYSFEQLSQLLQVVRFGTSAIEGAFWVEMDLMEALNLVGIVSPYRMSISVSRCQVECYLKQSSTDRCARAEDDEESSDLDVESET